MDRISGLTRLQNRCISIQVWISRVKGEKKREPVTKMFDRRCRCHCFDAQAIGRTSA
ncbi:unnamed protein product [Musa hybrid cultivar]